MLVGVLVLEIPIIDLSILALHLDQCIVNVNRFAENVNVNGLSHGLELIDGPGVN